MAKTRIVNIIEDKMIFQCMTPHCNQVLKGTPKDAYSELRRHYNQTQHNEFEMEHTGIVEINTVKVESRNA